MLDSTIYKKVENYLMDLISQNADIPNFKLPSERALCQLFHSSRKPIRHAYDRLIARRLVENIHGRGYFISNTAHQEFSSSLKNAAPKISMIIPSVLTQFSHDILAGASDFCSNHQLELAIHVSQNSAAKEADLLHSLPISGTRGIVLFPVDQDTSSHDELLRLSLRKFPLVLVDRRPANLHVPFVSSENHQAMVNAVEFLQKKNYKNIVYVTVPAGIASTTDARVNGFTHGLLRFYKLATPRNLLVVDAGLSKTKDAVVQYLREHPDTEVLIFTGPQYKSVISAAMELNLRIPDDLRLMIIDDELPPRDRISLKPYILQQDGYQIGYLAAESLYNQIYGDLRPVTKLLPMSIIDTSAETKKDFAYEYR